jgi:hypothetical protein
LVKFHPDYNSYNLTTKITKATKINNSTFAFLGNIGQPQGIAPTIDLTSEIPVINIDKI